MTEATTYIIGAGVTGLGAGMMSGAPVLEQADGPGGICRSYYLRPGCPPEGPNRGDERLQHPPPDGDAFRFEVGGGHWIFGAADGALAEPNLLGSMKTYERRASIRLRDGTTVPYPLQSHVDLLGPDIAARVEAEQATTPTVDSMSPTLAVWLEQCFGRTLCELFFWPFHDRYTAGLTATVAPQDEYKSPRPGTSPVPGYNTTFGYPKGGLDGFVAEVAGRCDVRYGDAVVAIDGRNRVLEFASGRHAPYDSVVSTVPLCHAVELAGLRPAAPTDPYTSVLVLNIGAERGPSCPDEHWQYEPDAAPGFHRIGFYSNVDRSFLPQRDRHGNGTVALYVERAFPGGELPGEREIVRYEASVLEELQRRRYIGRVLAMDASWVDVAYTWRAPGSRWREEAIALLADNGIEQAGRYGRWHFQGIADSVREGIEVGRRLSAEMGSR